MEYRVSEPDDFGCEDEAEVHDALQDFIQDVMAKSEPDDIMDTLVIMANIADIRAIGSGSLERRQWYARLSVIARGVLKAMGKDNFAQPDMKLEDPSLYFPNIDHNIH